MTYEFMADLCESRLFPSRTALQKWDDRRLSHLAYFYFLALRILLSETMTAEWAQHYCHRISQANNFATWRNDGSDFYVLLYALTSDDEFRTAKRRVSTGVILDWFRHTTTGFEVHTGHLFSRLDGMMQITDSGWKALRRAVAHWPDIDEREQQDVIANVIQQLRRSAPNSELLSHLKQISRQYEIAESATSGATGSAAVATAVGTLGVGFEAAGQGYEKSIYAPKKKIPVVRRSADAEMQSTR